jgi:hypothetical protein
LVFDTAGNLYGMTGNCGKYELGSIFQLVPPATGSGVWTYTIVYDVGGYSTPFGGLVLDRMGNFYGLTESPTTAFKLTPPATKGGAWIESTIFRFEELPNGPLIIGTDGALYGTTLNGRELAYGTVFRLRSPKETGGAWRQDILYTFQGQSDGASPRAGLVFDESGNLYGTTTFSGTVGVECEGTRFRLWQRVPVGTT